MSVTAARLHGTPLALDWTGLTQCGVKHAASNLDRSWNTLSARFKSLEVGFYQAPAQNELSQAKESVALAEELLKTGMFTDCLFLGIGGSSLGPISLLSALKASCRPGLHFHFVENPDGTDWRFRLSQLAPERTLVVAVTKSGGTFETMALLLDAMSWLGQARWKTHLVAVTDPTQGDLRRLAQHLGLKNLAIHPSIGGRFSVFSPVGLFPAALAGLNVQKFLDGAASVKNYCEKTAHDKNPLLFLGAQWIGEFKRRPIHVCMPYSTCLERTAAWFVQLWAESLGKDGEGFTPVAAVGANDQHSLLQLLRDGPDDKITFFIEVTKNPSAPTLAKLDLPITLKLGSFQLLGGHSLDTLLEAELHATAQVLTRKGRPNIILKLEKLDEANMGALYFSLAVMTAFTGTLWNVNPFDQPGVQEGKTLTEQMLQSIKNASTSH